MLNECIPLLDDSSCDDDARVRYQAANRIVLILWDYIKEMIEQVKKDQANGAGSTAKLIQNLTDALADQSAKASLPDRKGKAVPCRKKMKHEKPSDNDVNTEIEEAIAYETGRMALEKTTDISDNGSGGVTYNLSLIHI